MERHPGTGSIVKIKRGNRVYFEARAWIVDELGNKHRETKLCSTTLEAEKTLRALLTSSEDVRRMKLTVFLDRWLAQARADIRPNRSCPAEWCNKLLSTRVGFQPVTTAESRWV